MDQELYDTVIDAKAGNQEAFSLLLHRYKNYVFRYAYGMLGDRTAAEDVAQETFIRAYYSLSKLESAYAFTSWLTRIAFHLCYDYQQKKRREITHDEKYLHAETGMDSVQGELEKKQLELTIKTAMSELSPEHREVVVLRDVQGYSYEEIAQLLRIPIGTVKSRINAARLILRKLIGQDGRL